MAHCGGSLDGDFIWSVTYTDIYSGWTTNRTVWNKGCTGLSRRPGKWRRIYPSSCWVSTPTRGLNS